jgi:hypothetical protein
MQYIAGQRDFPLPVSSKEKGLAKNSYCLSFLEALLDASKEVGLELNPEKTKHVNVT